MFEEKERWRRWIIWQKGLKKGGKVVVDKLGGDETYQTIPQHPHNPLRISSPLSRTATKVQVMIVQQSS
jgi:hypothetical protein